MTRGGLYASCLSFGVQVKVRPVVIFSVPSAAQIVKSVSNQKPGHALVMILRHMRQFVHDERPTAQILFSGEMYVAPKRNAHDSTPTRHAKDRPLPDSLARERFQGGVKTNAGDDVRRQRKAGFGE